MTPPSQTPFAQLHPLLRGVNVAIYRLWRIPLPERETLTAAAVTVPPLPTLPAEAPRSGSLQDHVPETLTSPPHRQNALPQTAPISEVPSSVPEPLAPSPQRLKPIARLGKMHWSKAKAANCAGRRKLKRSQGS